MRDWSVVRFSPTHDEREAGVAVVSGQHHRLLRLPGDARRRLCRGQVDDERRCGL